jgi:hypothetical protein
MAETPSGYASGSALTVAGAALTGTFSYINKSGQDLFHNGWFVFSFVILCLGVGVIVLAFLSHVVSLSRRNLSYDPKTRILTIGRKQPFQSLPLAENVDSSAASSLHIPVLVLTQGGRRTEGWLQELDQPMGDLIGYIYVSVQMNVAALHDNTAPVTIMRVTATVEFDGESKESASEMFEWYDATHRNEIRPDTGPVIVSPGRVLRVSTSFMVPAYPAVEGVDEPGRTCHLPPRGKISNIVAIDSLARRYELSGETDFPVLIPAIG